MNHRFFTSESVTEGHPDKLCDCVADAILDALLAQDPDTRCACEVTCEPSALRILGEVTTKAVVDYNAVARGVLREIGYTGLPFGNAQKGTETHNRSFLQSYSIFSSLVIDGISGFNDSGLHCINRSEYLAPGLLCTLCDGRLPRSACV